jgi:hypothetical protein
MRDNVAARTQEKFGIQVPRWGIVHVCDNYPVRWVCHEDSNQADLPELIGAVSRLGGIILRDYNLLWNAFVSSHRANHE